jgi:hypothetical protein
MLRHPANKRGIIASRRGVEKSIAPEEKQGEAMRG